MQISEAKAQYDIVIIGAGMVGAGFALALAARQSGKDLQQKLSILLIESSEINTETGQSAQFDARTTALSQGSRQIFESLGLWPEFSPHAVGIEHIHVSDRGHFGATRLAASDVSVEALGYVLENRVLGSVLNRAVLAAPQIELLAPARVARLLPQQQGMQVLLAGQEDAGETAIQAGLVVLADGGRSGLVAQLGIESTEKRYQQCAVIANLAFEKSHANVAYERFTDTGPIAVLPLADQEGEHRGALIWTLPAGEAAAIAELADEAFLELLQQRFGYRLGRLTRVGERVSFPLSLKVATEQARPGLVLLGNVAHTLHPVAGQGLNLALRDAVALADSLVDAALNKVQPGTMKILQGYVSGREADQRNTIVVSDQLIALFSNDSIGMSLLRKAGLLGIDMIAPVKKAFTRSAMGVVTPSS